MTLEPSEVAKKVEAQIASITEPRVAAALRRHLVPPRPCVLDWDYGNVHPEFPEPRYPGFIVAELEASGTGIAYSEHGFGPKSPWGLIWLSEPGYGMDSGWYATLEDAFRESMVWDETPPNGHEVR